MSTQGGSGSGSQYPPEHEQEPPPQKKQQTGDDKDNKQPEKLNQCDTDSENEYDGTRKLTREERARYNKQVEESGGFDVESFTQTFECLITPLTWFNQFPKLEDYSNQAIRKYNTQNNTNYQFVEVLKANAQVISGLEYYITFAAKEDSATADGGGQSPPEISRLTCMLQLEERQRSTFVGLNQSLRFEGILPSSFFDVVTDT